jgi:hypothetical protein
VNERINGAINKYQTAGFLSMDTMIRQFKRIFVSFANYKFSEHFLKFLLSKKLFLFEHLMSAN